jgi:hypothetical protein
MNEADERMIEKLERNGFTRPFHPHQIGSWVAYGLMIVLYFTILFPTLNAQERIGITIPYVALFVSFNVFFVMAELESHRSPYVNPTTTREKHRLCTWCGRNVREECKHCRCCNVCRLGFDHHCFFLNNCVTSANYEWFFLGISFLTISAIFTTLLVIWVFMSIEYGNGEPIDRAAKFYGSKVPKGVIYAFGSFLLFEMLGIEVFMNYLLALHFLLIKRHVTTFELICYRRELRAQREAQGASH